MDTELDQYTYTVEWSPEDNAHVARVREFKSLAAHGETEEDDRED